MLDSLHDMYTYFRDVDATSERGKEDAEENTVSYRMLDRSVGYIKISTFSSRHCVEETRRALLQLHAAKALVLDLRSNGGGSIEDTFKIFAMFVASGRFVLMDGVDEGLSLHEELFAEPDALAHHHGQDVERSARDPNLSGRQPLVVLINEETKSAAEMLAGALHDNKRALLIGCTSFGKGVVQRIWQFDNGTSVKITSSNFTSPHGARVDHVGIHPDILVADSSHGKADDRLLQRARLILAEKLHSAPIRMALMTR